MTCPKWEIREILSRFPVVFSDRARTFLKQLIDTMKAPLRLIAARSLEVYEFFRGSEKPRLFAVHDHLECGHIHTSLLWDYLDLVDGYTENPEVSARRRRCHPCAGALAKKPVQSVTTAYAAKAGVA